MIEFGYGVNDAFWRVVWAIDEETVWAKGFSEEKFLKVEEGMTKKEVLKLLGEPLNGTEDFDETRDSFWYYTWHSRGNADFDQRWVVFGLDDKVKEIRKSFYID